MVLEDITIIVEPKDKETNDEKHGYMCSDASESKIRKEEGILEVLDQDIPERNIKENMSARLEATCCLKSKYIKE